jgi:hypothetical protein
MNNKNIIIAVGLIGLAYYVYTKNKNKGILTVGVDAKMSNMCGSCGE